jgi:hypothetical protein
MWFENIIINARNCFFIVGFVFCLICFSQVFNMKNSATQIAVSYFLAGIILSATTLLLFYNLTNETNRSETFTFTVLLVIFQEFLLFGSLTFASLFANKISTPVPIMTGYFSTVLIYNVTSVITIVLFEFSKVFLNISPNIYYTIAIAEIGIWLSFVVLLRLAGIAYNVSHLDSETKYSGIQEMISTCGRLQGNIELHGWKFPELLNQLADRIRFSEGIRRDATLFNEVSNQLKTLEMLTKTGGDDLMQKKASIMVEELLILTKRRA